MSRLVCRALFEVLDHQQLPFCCAKSKATVPTVGTQMRLVDKQGHHTGRRPEPWVESLGDSRVASHRGVGGLVVF